ncbi:LysR family transcriptional regulator [Marinomonas sp. TI.3.20]|uniref:LysR family transcriptional regulator n=1 Tax=Marinomonas sp. TI.3.20 TaxID=3121296 RepID=UPI00311F6C23
MNWDDAKFFYEVAKLHTLRAAGRSLNVDQATVGRRISSLERNLNHKLFHRTKKEFVLTDIGESIYSEISMINSKFESIEYKSKLMADNVSGVVKISTTDTLAKKFIIPSIKKVQNQYPNIKIILNTSVTFSDVSNLNSDIAIRGSRPDSDELVIKKLASISMGLYASPELAKKIDVNHISEISKLDNLIMFDKKLVPRHWEKLFDVKVDNNNVSVQCDSQDIIIESVRASLGVGMISKFMINNNDDSLVNVVPDFQDVVDIWLVVHPDLKSTPKYRIVIDEIVRQFQS